MLPQIEGKTHQFYPIFTDSLEYVSIRAAV